MADALPPLINMRQPTDEPATPRDRDQDAVVVPVVEEVVHVGKEQVETGAVRISKTIRDEVQEVEVPLTSREVEVRRVEVGRVIDDASNPPKPRQEGDLYIIPVLEEVAVTVKKLVLREEIHLHTKESQTVYRDSVEVRREEATVERLPGQASHPGAHPGAGGETT